MRIGNSWSVSARESWDSGATKASSQLPRSEASKDSKFGRWKEKFKDGKASIKGSLGRSLGKFFTGA